MSSVVEEEQSECWDDLELHLKNGILQVGKKSGLKVSKVSVKLATAKGDNFMGKVFRVTLTGFNHSQEMHDLNLILKSNNLKLTDKISNNMFSKKYCREIFTYSEFLSELKKIEDKYEVEKADRFEYPIYYASSSEPGKEWIILEDISTSGFKMKDKFKAMDREHVWIAVKALAKYHALAFVLRCWDRAAYDLFIDEFSKIKFEPYEDYLKKVLDLSADALRDEDEACKRKFAQFSESRLKDYFAMINHECIDSIKIICHSDCWNNNFMYKYQNGKPIDVRILDWQETTVSAPTLDLVHLLCSNTEEEFRAKYWSQTLEMYYEVLSSAMKFYNCDPNTIYPKSTYENHLKYYFPLGLMVAIVAWPYTLSMKEDDMNVTDHLSESTECFDSIKFSNIAENRLKGLIRDFVKFNYL